MQQASLNWVTIYSNTEDHYFNIHTTKMTNVTSPKKYPGAGRQIMHAEFQWVNPFQTLTHLPLFDFHSVSYNTNSKSILHWPKIQSHVNCKRSLPFTKHKTENEDYHLLGCDTVKAGTNLPTFGGTPI
jgi:hypothetical protein